MSKKSMKTLKVGDAIPPFNAVDQDNEPLAREDLLGNPFVLYFYPKDDTPGCTQEACEFRDVMESFDDVEIAVIGVSADSPESHQQFIEKHELNFPLISDSKLDLANKCGVVGSDKRVVRSTFICDDEGIVQWVESPVTVEGHVQRVISAIQEVLA